VVPIGNDAFKLALRVLRAAIATLSAPPNAMVDAAKVSPVDAINHIGQIATVCGRVAQVVIE